MIYRCKEDLLRTAHVDAMVRASLSVRCKEEVPDLDKWTGLYFGEWQDQQGLKEFLETTVRAPITIHCYQLHEFRLAFQHSKLLHLSMIPFENQKLADNSVIYDIINQDINSMVSADTG